MEHLDKILEKLIEQNGGKVVSRQQFLDNDGAYWERRFADQAMDEMVAAQTGISTVSYTHLTLPTSDLV